MIIAPKRLSQEALDNLIDEYCLRDRGLIEDGTIPLDSHRKQVRAALDSGKLIILYSKHFKCAKITSPVEMMEH